MESLRAYMPVDRRHALAWGEALLESVNGAVLITDISGFTALTEALVAHLGVQRGSEELSRHLNTVYGVLIQEVMKYGGSIIVSAGDALLSWFQGDGKESALRAATAAFGMRSAVNDISTIVLANGQKVQIRVKSVVAHGPAFRFLVGDPESQVFDVLAGTLLDRLDQAADLAHRGEVLLEAETAQMVGEEAFVIEQRQARDGVSASVIRGLKRMSDPRPWPILDIELGDEQVRPWLHPSIYERIRSGQETFMAELRPAVSMFVRFAGINYESDPVEARQKLDRFVRWMQKHVHRYDGRLVEITTGDKGSNAYIAFGTPHAHEDDAARAAALAQTLLALPLELGFIGGIQIGISQGQIWSGPIGTADWRSFFVIGNEVNVASRLMEATQPGQMLASERVAEATRSVYDWRMVRELPVKGLSKPVKVFNLVSSKSTSRAEKLMAPATIVGREAERGLLRELLDHIPEEGNKVVILEGEAGIGKSRLLSDLLSQAQRKNMPVLVGAGYAIEQSTSYHAWRPVFEAVFGLSAAEDGESRREKALDWLKTRDARMLDRAPLLAPVLSFDAQDNQLTEQMTGQVRAENTRILLMRILRLFIDNSPKLLVLEDAHWFDSASWSLAADVARMLSNLMIVLSTRPLGDGLRDYLGMITELPQTYHIRLEQMSRGEIEVLVAQRLGVARLPDEITALIMQKAEGHPFFSEELAYAMRDAGVVRVIEGECRVAQDIDLRTFNFPDTVQGVITSRIDRLAPSHQLALKAASVVGRIFALRAVSTIYPLENDRPLLGSYFEYLRKLDLTPLNSEIPDLTYLFKHVITQEVAYNLMPFSQRQMFHEAVAGWYEHTFADDLSPYYGVLAYHWNNARKPEKAVAYLEKAGEQAMKDFANREAIDLFTEALRLVESREVEASNLRRAHWERQLAEAHYGLGELPKSLDHLKRAIHLMGWPTPERGLGLIGALLVEVFRQVGLRMRPKLMIEAVLPTYLEDTQPARLLEGAIAFVRLGHIYYQMNNPILLIFGNVRGSNLAEKAGLKSPILVRGYTNMCIASGVLPRHDWAIAYRDRAHAIGRDVGDLPALAYSLAGCAVYELGAALWEDATKSLNESIEIDARIGDMRHFDEGKSLLAIARFHQGEFQYGLDTAVEVLERATRRKDIIPQVWSHTLRAEVFLRQSKPGTLKEAIAGYEAALKLLEQNIDQASDIRASGALALACWRDGNPLRALDLAAATAKKTVGNPTAPYAIEGYAGVVEVFLAAWERGDTSQRAAAQKACKAMAKFAGVFPLGQARARLLQGWFNWLDGKKDRAVANWQAAQATAEKFSLPYEQARACLYLGKYVGIDREQNLRRALEMFERLDVYHEAEEIRSLKS